jgi:hypothetical protein
LSTGLEFVNAMAKIAAKTEIPTASTLNESGNPAFVFWDPESGIAQLEDLRCCVFRAENRRSCYEKIRPSAF